MIDLRGKTVMILSGETVRAMIRAKRNELALSSPEKPQDAPKADQGQYAPTEG